MPGSLPGFRLCMGHFPGEPRFIPIKLARQEETMPKVAPSVVLERTIFRSETERASFAFKTIAPGVLKEKPT